MIQRLKPPLRLFTLTALSVTACSEQPSTAPVDPLERQLDTRQEVLHQTREVIRYLEEEERLRREQLNSRAD
ncbi:hypothetical protein [Sedimenticola selenatireducens]|uniref:Uncharacterized protein n=1 Tax=Sedimenticola selenatireducens TaxID=191960 RepID=A0A2N6CZR1_9GAMM|nr:hypothetical protein [Sedimenticola selenatireducens]PLX62879.1 MAG: hypothetical protein C0630_04755 [Sedimenticola selenatireducens]